MSAQRILVVANETVGGTALIDAVKRHADAGDVSVHVICPQNAPKHGYVIYDGTVREAAENRLSLTIAQLKEIGVEATGEVMDPDPYSAIMDAVGENDYDEIIVSTHPETRSGWLRQDLITRVEKDTDVPGRARGRRPRRRPRARQARAGGGQPDRRRRGADQAARGDLRGGGRAQLRGHRARPARTTTRAPRSAWPTRSSASRTRACRRSARWPTPTPSPRSRTRCSSTPPTRS